MKVPIQKIASVSAAFAGVKGNVAVNMLYKIEMEFAEETLLSFVTPISDDRSSFSADASLHQKVPMVLPLEQLR